MVCIICDYFKQGIAGPTHIFVAKHFTRPASCQPISRNIVYRLSATGTL